MQWIHHSIALISTPYLLSEYVCVLRWLHESAELAELSVAGQEHAEDVPEELVVRACHQTERQDLRECPQKLLYEPEWTIAMSVWMDGSGSIGRDLDIDRLID